MGPRYTLDKTQEPFLSLWERQISKGRSTVWHFPATPFVLCPRYLEAWGQSYARRNSGHLTGVLAGCLSQLQGLLALFMATAECHISHYCLSANKQQVEGNCKRLSLQWCDFLSSDDNSRTVSGVNCLRLCKICGFHGGDDECRLLGYKYSVRTSQETHYVYATELSRLMLCKIWGFHGSDYEECRLLRYKNPVRTSQETHYFSTTESSRLMPCKI
jgi:hypothetical protein